MNYLEKTVNIGLKLCLIGFLTMILWKIIVAYAYQDPLLIDVIQDNSLLPQIKPGGDGVAQLKNLIENNLIYYVKWIMVAVSILYISLYGFLYITSSGTEENITEQHDNLIWAVIGFAVIGLANLSGKVFNPIEDTPGSLWNTQEFHNTAMLIVVYIEYILGAIAILYMLLGAVRFIMAGGDETVISNEKKNFTWGFFGLIIVMIADTFIKTVYDAKTGKFAGETGTKIFSEEIFGVVNFLLAWMSVIGVLTLVIASIYYVNAFGDEETTEKATKIIKSTIIGFIIIAIAYVIVNTFAR